MASAPRFTSKRTLSPQKPPGLYRSTYSPELAAAICRRVAAGESLRSICRADPSMPTGKTVWNWARAHPDFAWLKGQALATARAASLAAQAERDAARRAKIGTGARVPWNAGADTYDEEIGEAICARLALGETVAAICASPLMPSRGTVYNWLRRHPEFLVDYRSAKLWAPEFMREIACERLTWRGARASWPMLRRVVRETDRRSARLSLKRYAPPEG